MPKFHNILINHGSPNLNELTVNAFIKDGRWDEEAIREIVLPYIGDEIHRIPLPQTPRSDSRYWNYDRKGRYPVKEGYRTGIGLQDKPKKSNDVTIDEVVAVPLVINNPTEN